MPRYFTFSGHIGVWAGGPGGTGPPKVLRSGKNPCVRIRENIKISEKLCYVRKTFVCVRKLRDIRGNFFGMSEKYFVCLRKVRVIRQIFLVYPEKFLYVCENYGVLGPVCENYGVLGPV
jgi:hypothetical protein